MLPDVTATRYPHSSWIDYTYTLFFILVSGRCDQASKLCKFYFFHQIFVWCKPNINCHRCHSHSESSSSIHVQISRSYVAKCKYISRTHRFLNLTVPGLKTSASVVGPSDRKLCPCRVILQRSLGLKN
jgi:hypothetical protein